MYYKLANHLYYQISINPTRKTCPQTYCKTTLNVHDIWLRPLYTNPTEDSCSIILSLRCKAVLLRLREKTNEGKRKSFLAKSRFLPIFYCVASSTPALSVRINLNIIDDAQLCTLSLFHIVGPSKDPLPSSLDGHDHRERNILWIIFH